MSDSHATGVELELGTGESARDTGNPCAMLSWQPTSSADRAIAQTGESVTWDWSGQRQLPALPTWGLFLVLCWFAVFLGGMMGRGGSE